MAYAKTSVRRRTRRRWIFAGAIALIIVVGVCWLPGAYRAGERRVFNIRRSQFTPIAWWLVLTSSELRQLAWSLSEQPHHGQRRFTSERNALPDVWCFGTELSDTSVTLGKARVSDGALQITLAVENLTQQTLLIPSLYKMDSSRTSTCCEASFHDLDLLSADVVLVPARESRPVTLVIPLVPDAQRAGAELLCGDAHIVVEVVPAGRTIGLEDRDLPRDWVSIEYGEGPGLDLISDGELEELLNAPKRANQEEHDDPQP